MAQSYQSGIRPEIEACLNCKYFIQHYMIWVGFDPLEWWHCTCPRLKTRKIFDCCDRFERKKEVV